MVSIKRLPAPIWESYQWQYDGACAETDTNRFFSPEHERGFARERRESAAKAFCERCPVVQQCLEHALSVREEHGVWGGLNPRERSDLVSGTRSPVSAA
ncbi:MAG: WhiB family transcriptional regulator [Aeromicrobium sp.]|uniref:WhiB family transcriptional regulator n=1 Tax=Aeromicrobium sp. TaxID=1871063 RepID=UPI003C5562B0